MTITASAGKAKGLEPRTSKCGAVIPLAPRERIPVIPRAAWIARNRIRWLERWKRDIDQGRDPACTLASLSHGLSFLLALQDSDIEIPPIDWRKAWIDVTGGRGGAALDDACSYAMGDGMPIVGGGRVYLREAYDAASLDEWYSALQGGFVCTYGHDQHAECALTPELVNGKWGFDDRNSWGRDWGDQGYHVMPLDEVEIDRYGAIILCRAEIVK